MAFVLGLLAFMAAVFGGCSANPRPRFNPCENADNPEPGQAAQLGTHPCKEEVKAEGVKVKLEVYPRVALWAYKPVPVKVVARVSGPDETLYCPAAVWGWGDGSVTVREADCPPWAAGAPAQRSYEVWPMHTYKAPGEYTITFLLVRGEQVVARAESTVDIKF